MELSSRIFYGIAFYVLIMALIIVSKPAFIFNKDGSLKQFGLSKTESMISIGMVSSILAIVSFYGFCLVDIFFA